MDLYKKRGFFFLTSTGVPVVNTPSLRIELYGTAQKTKCVCVNWTENKKIVNISNGVVVATEHTS